jgi:hypothetical protein
MVPGSGEGRVQVKKLLTAVVAVSLAVGMGSAVAAGGPPSKETVSGDFVLTAAQCPNLPAGTTITGTGSGDSFTSVLVGNDGLVTIANTTHSHGTATDQAGNAYVFNYSNSFRVTNSAADPGVFSGQMTDSFVLAGNGPAHLNNGFTAVFTTDFETFFSFEELNSRGDPLDFTTGAAVCDPL